MEKINFKCPQCRMDLEVEAAAAGRTADCPECQHRIVIPAATSAPAVARQPAASPAPPAVPPPPAPNVTSPPPPPTVAARRTCGLAVASLVLGILSIVPGPMCCGPVLAILGIVFALNAQAQIDRQPAALEGKGMAIAGLVTSIVGLAFALYLVFVFSTVGFSTAAIMKALLKLLPVH